MVGSTAAYRVWLVPDGQSARRRAATRITLIAYSIWRAASAEKNQNHRGKKALHFRSYFSHFVPLQNLARVAFRVI
jgi:hypothetical protein